MSYRRTFVGELTAYRGGGNNLYPLSDGNPFIVGLQRTSSGSGSTVGSEETRYGVLARFDFSSIPSNTTVTGITANVVRTYGYSELIYSVSLYHSAPSDSVAEIARTGYAYIANYRTDVTFTSGADATSDYSRSFSVSPSYYNNVKENGWLLYGRDQARRILVKEVSIVIETNEDEFTLSYNANEGTDAPEPQTGIGVATYDFVISDSIPVRNNYKFVGWSLSKDATDVYKAGDTLTANKVSSTLYAIWELDIGTLTFDNNTGTGDIPSITDTIGTSVTISELIPEKYGWTFVAWNTKQDGTGTDYKVGDKYTIATTEATLYAKFRENIRTLIYNANGGEGAPVAFTDVWSNPIPISNQIPFRQNHLFRGWATTPTATEPQYDIGDSYTGTEDVELFAVWKQAEYSVFVNDNGKWYSVSDVFTMDDEWKDKSIPFVNDENHRFKTTKL